MHFEKRFLVQTAVKRKINNLLPSKSSQYLLVSMGLLQKEICKTHG